MSHGLQFSCFPTLDLAEVQNSRTTRFVCAGMAGVFELVCECSVVLAAVLLLCTPLTPTAGSPDAAATGVAPGFALLELALALSHFLHSALRRFRACVA